MSYKFAFRGYADALYEALKEDAFYQTMEDSVDEKRDAKEAMLKYLDYSISESKKFGELYIPSEHKYGVSVWSKPLNQELSTECSELKKAFLKNELGENSLQTYSNIVQFMSKEADSLIDPDAWYLSIIGILPGYQGQGLGPGLVAPVLEQTDKFGVSTYLETFTPRNKSFYQRLGYKEIANIYEPTTGTEYAIMQRNAYGD